MQALTLLILSFLALTASAGTCENKGPNVILFTWDGVRTHEFFKGTGAFHAPQLKKEERGVIFKKFWTQHASSGVIFGKKGNQTIGSDIAISLPSYQAITTGESTHCRKNNCKNIKQPSVFETVRTGLKLEKKDVAVFASWDKMSLAIASDPNSITHSVYPSILDEGSSDPEMKSIQEEAMKDLPHWHGSRKDKYTFALGIHYLKKECPRLLYISLVDSDEFGHEKKYPEYVSSLRTYDDYLDEVISTLRQLGKYGEQTTLILTTDHSRGPGPLWFDHALTGNSEKEVFLYAYGRGVKPTGHTKEDGNHNQIKPTIEYLMGLPTTKPKLPNILVE